MPADAASWRRRRRPVRQPPPAAPSKHERRGTGERDGLVAVQLDDVGADPGADQPGQLLLGQWARDDVTRTTVGRSRQGGAGARKGRQVRGLVGAQLGGVPAAKFRPMASAPARRAARSARLNRTTHRASRWRRPDADPPSTGGRPAATEPAAGAASRVAGAHQRLADEGGVEADRAPAADRGGSRTPDSATTSRSSGTRGRSATARSGSTSSVRRSRLLIADERRARSRAPSRARARRAPRRAARGPGPAPARRGGRGALADAGRRAAGRASAPGGAEQVQLPRDRPRTPWPAPAR